VHINIVYNTLIDFFTIEFYSFFNYQVYFLKLLFRILIDPRKISSDNDNRL